LTDELYGRAIRELPLPRKRHYGHTDDLEKVIWLLLLDAELATMPMTRVHEAVLQRVLKTWAEADDGFTFAPVPQQPPLPPPDASPEEAELSDLTLNHRHVVKGIRILLPRESVGRCLEALSRTNKNVSEAIAWLLQTSNMGGH
jgi:hypothetical protein